MTKLIRASLLLAACLLALSACKEEKAAQDIAPRDMTAQTLGYYCQMNLLEHPGPKAQVHLEGMPAPLFFSQVRDGIAYVRSSEKIAPILAIYVNDMGAPNATWEKPGDGNWIAADQAFYVVGSAREGGMGAPETVPFASEDKAEAFAGTEGGQVVRLSEITDDMVLTPVEAGNRSDPDDKDYSERLDSLSHSHGG